MAASAGVVEEDSKKKPRDGTPMIQEEEGEGEGTLEVVLPKPPDGGWGWVIVGASLLINIIVDGIAYTFGIFLPKFEEAFQQPKSTIALAGSLQVGTYLCAGPIVSALTNRFGCKKVTMVGSVVATAGFVLSVFAPSADILILTYGFIGGFGFGMMYLPAIVIVGYYFEKRRALATGIAVCGSGVGMFIMAPLFDLLLQEFGYKGALLIIAGLIFNGAICGALMRPLPLAQVQATVESTTKDQDGTTAEADESMTKPEAEENGNDVIKPDPLPATTTTPPASTSPTPRAPPIVILDEGRPSSNKTSSSSGNNSSRDELAFFSVPNMVYASARKKDSKSHPHLGSSTGGLRQSSNTLDPADRIRLRRLVAQEVVPEIPKPAIAPIDLSDIGLSDAQINRVRATVAHANVPCKDISFISGSKLHIPVQSDQSLWRSAQSMRSYRSAEEEEKRPTKSVPCACLPESARDTLLQMLDFSIMRNKAYVLILIGNVFAMLGFNVPFVFLPEKALELGLSEGKAAFLLSIIGITNTVGRVLTGVLANLNKIDSLVINNIAMLVCGVATFLIPFCNSYELLCVVAAVFGLCVAAYISLSSILLCDMLGVEQLTNAIGFLTLARGVSTCAGSPVAGAIIDSTQDVDLAFFVGGALIVVGGLFHCMLHTPCIRHKRESPHSMEHDVEV